MVMSQSTLVHVCIDSAGFDALESVFVLGEWNKYGAQDREVKTNDWKYYINRWDLVQCAVKKEELEVVLVDDLNEVLQERRLLC